MNMMLNINMNKALITYKIRHDMRICNYSSTCLDSFPSPSFQWLADFLKNISDVLSSVIDCVSHYFPTYYVFGHLFFHFFLLDPHFPSQFLSFWGLSLVDISNSISKHLFS